MITDFIKIMLMIKILFIPLTIFICILLEKEFIRKGIEIKLTLRDVLYIYLLTILCVNCSIFLGSL